MQEFTLNDILKQAFEQARDLDAPLAGRLQAFADSVRFASPPFAEAADRLINRLQQSGSGATAPKIGDVMPDFVLPDDRGRLVSLEGLRERWSRGAVVSPRPLVPLLPAEHQRACRGAMRSGAARRTDRGHHARSHAVYDA